MVQLLLDAQNYIIKAEDLVLQVLDDKKFLVDRNSVVTNIDIISQYAVLVRAEEKNVLKKPLVTTESLYLNGKNRTIFFVLFWKDLCHSFSSLKSLLPNTIVVLEYLALSTIVMISIFTVIAPFLGQNSDLFSYLPLFGFLGLLLYIYNLCNLKNVTAQILVLIIMFVLYFYGISLLKSTFAF